MHHARSAATLPFCFFSPRLFLFFLLFVSMMINYILPTLPDCFVRSDDNVSIFELRNALPPSSLFCSHFALSVPLANALLRFLFLTHSCLAVWFYVCHLQSSTQLSGHGRAQSRSNKERSSDRWELSLLAQPFSKVELRLTIVF